MTAHATLADPGSTLYRLHLRLARVESWAGAVSNLAQFTVMAIVVADVVGRYVLNSPIEWVYDVISRYLMALVFFFALSWTLGTGEHVRVLFFRQFVSRRVRRAFDLLSAVAGGAVFALILVASLDRFWTDWTTNAVFTGAYLWPNWISSICVPIGVALMLLRFALLAAVHAVAIAAGADPLGLGDDELY